MWYIFFDESWCLWFNSDNKKTSKYFVATFLFTENKRSVEKVVKKIFSWFSKKEVKRHNGILHSYKEHPKTITKLFSLLKEKDVSVMCVYVDKTKVHIPLHNEKHILYNYITNILLDRIITNKLLSSKNITFIASRRETNKYLNENFKSYISKNNWRDWITINVEIKTCLEEKCLQVVDACSWAIFRKYEYSNYEFYNMFNDKIIEENTLF